MQEALPGAAPATAAAAAQPAASSPTDGAAIAGIVAAAVAALLLMLGALLYWHHRQRGKDSWGQESKVLCRCAHAACTLCLLMQGRDGVGPLSTSPDVRLAPWVVHVLSTEHGCPACACMHHMRSALVSGHSVQCTTHMAAMRAGAQGDVAASPSGRRGLERPRPP